MFVLSEKPLGFFSKQIPTQTQTFVKAQPLIHQTFRWYLKWRTPHLYKLYTDTAYPYGSFPTPKMAGYKIQSHLPFEVPEMFGDGWQDTRQ